MSRAVFLDRDGVICRNRVDHVKSWEEFEFLDGALEALQLLARTDLSIIVVTNQAIINRGIVSAEVVEDIHRRMVQTIQARGGRIDRVLYCPHRPDEHCECRKPRPGLLLQAAQEMGIDLAHSYLIGDAWSDIAAGQAVGCRSLMVLTGRGVRQFLRSVRERRNGFEVVSDLRAAVDVILQAEGLLIPAPAQPIPRLKPRVALPRWSWAMP